MRDAWSAFSITDHRAPITLFGFPCGDGVAAQSDRFLIEFIDKDQHALNSSAEGAYRHGGSADVDDVFIDADRIMDRLAFILDIESFGTYLAAFGLSENEQFDIGASACWIDSDHIGHGLMLADRVLN